MLTWCIPLKIKNSKTMTQDFSKIIFESKRNPFKLESDRVKDWYKSVFQNFF